MDDIIRFVDREEDRLQNTGLLNLLGKKKLMIGAALATKPKILMLDEPTSALDRAVQVQMIELLRGLQVQHGLSYLFISHDLKVVRAMANRIIVMKQGKCDYHFVANDQDYNVSVIPLL